MTITTSKIAGTENFAATVLLSNGEIAGEGYGPSADSAQFWALYCAIRSGTPAFVTAGFGHLVYLRLDVDRARLEAFRGAQ